MPILIAGTGVKMVFVSERRVYAERVHKYAPPPWRMFDALVLERDLWLRLREREVDPGVIKSERPTLVVWGSLWPVSPDDTIEFHLSSEDGGTAMRFTWYSASPPDDRGVGFVRQRLNRALGEDLREWVDTEVPLG